MNEVSYGAMHTSAHVVLLKAPLFSKALTTFAFCQWKTLRLLLSLQLLWSLRLLWLLRSLQWEAAIFNQLKRKITLKAKRFLSQPCSICSMQSKKGWKSVPTPDSEQSINSSHPLLYLSHCCSWHSYPLNCNLLQLNPVIAHLKGPPVFIRYSGVTLLPGLNLPMVHWLMTMSYVMWIKCSSIWKQGRIHGTRCA